MGAFPYTGPRLRLLSPDGGEEWHVFQNDTVRWSGYSVTNLLCIELNRHYPLDTWEILTDEVENDGEQAVFVTDPLSDSCRVRISAIGDVYRDSSSANFSIVSSQGYLALVLQSQPATPILSWNAGTHECPETVAMTYKFKNFGSENIVVFAPSLITGSEFVLAHNCPAFLALAPNQMSTCSLTVTFNPQSEGIHRDTIRIQTDAINAVGGYVHIPLSGEQIRTPESPQIVIQPSGNDAVLSWVGVDESVGGCAIDVTRYLVFFSEELDGPYWYHGSTADASYTHVEAVRWASGMLYHVVATTASPVLFASLPDPNSGHRVAETEILDVLQRAFATVVER